MKVEIVMPKMGESITEGTIVKWCKKVGDYVKQDEILLEISTDKVDSEIPSTTEGTLVEILAQENETVEVGKPIAIIETEKNQTTTPSPSPEEISRLPTQKITPPTTTTTPPKDTSRAGFFSPLVLNIAKKEGIPLEELQQIPGTGRGGRVTKKDILLYIQNKKTQPTLPPTPQPLPTTPIQPSTPTQPSAPNNEIEILPMDNRRKKIALHMRQSLDTSAHVYSVAECDVSKIIQFIQTHKTTFQQQEDIKLTFNPFVLQATIRALREYPLLNSSIEGETILRKKRIHLGLAVATEKGLLVPVIKNADEKNFRGLCRASYELAQKARSGKISPDELQGSTFTVTNPGVFGNIFGLPIINQPNVAILGVGAIKKRPVVIETPLGDQIAIRSMVYLSLSFDHRLIDGDVGGKFLQTIVHYLENFQGEPL